MDNRNFQVQNEYNENPKKGKTFWRNFGLLVLAVVLAVITVVIMNLNNTIG